MRLQRGGVQFSSADELFRVLDLPSDLADLWRPHLAFTGTAMHHRNRCPIDWISTLPAPWSSALGWPEAGRRFLLARRQRGFRI